MTELGSFRKATHIFTLVMKHNINVQLPKNNFSKDHICELVSWYPNA